MNQRDGLLWMASKQNGARAFAPNPKNACSTSSAPLNTTPRNGSRPMDVYSTKFLALSTLMYAGIPCLLVRASTPDCASSATGSYFAGFSRNKFPEASKTNRLGFSPCDIGGQTQGRSSS